MDLQDYSERILAPAMNALAAAIAADVMTGGTAICNVVAAQSGGATVSPSAAQFLQANAVLDLTTAPIGRRMVVATRSPTPAWSARWPACSTHRPASAKVRDRRRQERAGLRTGCRTRPC